MGNKKGWNGTERRRADRGTWERGTGEGSRTALANLKAIEHIRKRTRPAEVESTERENKPADSSTSRGHV